MPASLLLLVAGILVASGWLRGALRSLGLSPRAALLWLGMLLLARTLSAWVAGAGRSPGPGVAMLALCGLVIAHTRAGRESPWHLATAPVGTAAAAAAAVAVMPEQAHTLLLPPALLLGTPMGMIAYLLSRSPPTAVGAAALGVPAGALAAERLRLVRVTTAAPPPVSDWLFDAAILAAVVATGLMQLLGAPALSRADRRR